MQKKGYTKIILWVFALPASSPRWRRCPLFFPGEIIFVNFRKMMRLKSLFFFILYLWKNCLFFYKIYVKI